MAPRRNVLVSPGGLVCNELMASQIDPDINSVLDRAAHGDATSIGELFERCRDRLRRMVQFRLDDRFVRALRRLKQILSSEE